MSKTVLVLGGGVGGLAIANVLVKTLAKKHRVVLIDRNDSHYFRPSYPLVMVNRRRPEQVRKSLANLKQKGVNFLQAEVTHLNTSRRQVETDKGAQNYDYLVVALGAEHHPESVPGLAEGSYNPYSFEDTAQLRQKLSCFKRGKIVVFISSLPYTGVIAPWEIMFLLDAYFRKQGLRGQVELTLATPETAPLPLAGPKVGESVRRMLEQRGIGLITQAKVLSLDLNHKKLILDHGIEVPGDLFMGIPSHWGPSALRDSGLVVPGGWIAVDPHTLKTRADRVFAVGDATATTLPVSKEWAPKAGFFAHYQAEVVARNIASMIAGEVPRFRFTGKAAGAVMITELGKGRLASINYYAKPRPRLTLHRPTRIAYWTKAAFEKYWLSRWL